MASPNEPNTPSRLAQADRDESSVQRGDIEVGVVGVHRVGETVHHAHNAFEPLDPCAGLARRRR